ncbi:MAG: FAD-binding oxidoreductase [Pseudomonadota bacterium]
MADRAAISLWDSSAEEPTVEYKLDSEVSTDLAIVGGGFTGLSTALHAAEKGVDCHVLEAKHIGYGGSGRNVGLVNAGLWLPPQDIQAEIGEERGSNFVRILGEMPAYVFSLIERHQIRCEATKSGTIHAAHSPKGFEDIARRAEEWQRLGAPVDLLDAKAASQKIGTDKFFGGLLDRRAGTINPMGYARGLARAARNAGAGISTGVTVTGLRREGENWLLETDSAPVRARMVVLGTNAYSDKLWPGLKNTFTMIHYFQLATEPLGDRAVHILPERQGLWDTGTIMFSLRRDRAGRILIGSMGKVIGSKDSGLSHRWASRNLKRLFPELGEIEFEEAWHGQIAMTPDHLPRIHRLSDGLFTPIGYNGRGITTGTMFGRAMAELAAGGSEDDLLLEVTDLQELSSAPFMTRFYQAAFTANQVWKSL